MYKIAITGKANSGKNTVGKLLVSGLRAHQTNALYASHPPLEHQFIAFADPLKKMLRTAFPKLPRKYLYGSSKYRAKAIPGAFKDGVPLTVRQALMDLGNDFGRKYQHDIWIQNFNYTYHKAGLKGKDLIIVTDVRFRNEFDHLKSLGFYQIRVVRKSQLAINDASETNQDGIHDSEFNWVLHNNGTLADLKEEVSKIVIML
jgi:hypothetical protein